MATAARSAPRWLRSGYGVGLKRIKISPATAGTTSVLAVRPSWRRFQSDDAGKSNTAMKEESTVEDKALEEDVSLEAQDTYPEIDHISMKRLERRKREWDSNTGGIVPDLQRRRLQPEYLEMLTAEGMNIEKLAKKRKISLPEKVSEHDSETAEALSALRTPRNIDAIHYAPLRRNATHGIPVCDLQLRSYDLAQLQLMSDFAMRAAYYLGLPAKGPIALPRITERWTVPRSHFIFKKSQENFERITLRRLVQIVDADVQAVRVWLAACMKWQAHGVGMKANVWEHEGLGVGERMDVAAEDSRREVAALFDGVFVKKNVATSKGMERAMSEEPWKRAVTGGVKPQLSGDVPRAF